MPEATQEAELERVYREQYRPLVGFLQQRLRDRGRAEELAQEAFVRALQRRPDNPRAWLYTVAANLARDEVRRLAVRRGHLHLVRDDSAAGASDGESEMMKRERAERARAALAELPERDREALLLKQRGLSYPEIAAELDLAVGSVGTTLSRARRRLAEAWTRRQSEGRGQ